MELDFKQIFVSNYLVSSIPQRCSSVFITAGFVKLNFSDFFIDRFELYLLFFKLDFQIGNSVLFDLWATDLSLLFRNFKSRFAVTYLFFNLYYPYFRVAWNVLPRFSRACFLLPTVVNYYWSAGWLEREIFDLFGIKFSGNPDLRRLLTDYGFSGYPLRKDFPLTGYTQVRYDDELKTVVSEPVSLTQGYRYFEFFSPWKLIFL